MSVNISAYQSIQASLANQEVTLIAVSKTKPNEDLMELYALGQRAFGENYVQELVDKAAALPKDIEWHFIGHLQSNKVKYIAPFVHLIHGVDGEKLLQEINKQAAKQGRVIDCLLQVHIAEEDTKFGFDEVSLMELLQSERLANYPNVQVKGLMGMASFSDDTNQVQQEFKQLKKCFDLAKNSIGVTCSILSMGMSGDYELAIQEGSNMVRIGSLLFGARNYPAAK
ncbi:MAG: YggS family pyridoxal phosphate-dependent enzyme [Sediminibacterium sp.]|nr:YggS family pyridoxal phosphate-dependent enzyme [Sediminibacterium sp.]MBP6144122.1 YggS family pyridoxal phosphate-dependent enzyme [Sediminibacterium sp.]